VSSKGYGRGTVFEKSDEGKKDRVWGLNMKYQGSSVRTELDTARMCEHMLSHPWGISRYDEQI